MSATVFWPIFFMEHKDWKKKVATIFPILFMGCLISFEILFLTEKCSNKIPIIGLICIQVTSLFLFVAMVIRIKHGMRFCNYCIDEEVILKLAPTIYTLASIVLFSIFMTNKQNCGQDTAMILWYVLMGIDLILNLPAIYFGWLYMQNDCKNCNIFCCFRQRVQPIQPIQPVEPINIVIQIPEQRELQLLPIPVQPDENKLQERIDELITCQYGSITLINEPTCSICTEKFEETSIVTVTKCNHVHHAVCIKKWFRQTASCPLCREKI
jgi:hypothetical protein